MAAHTLALISLEGGIDQAMLQEVLQKWGYGVIFLAMLLENAGVPLPGETVTLLGGYAAGSGQLNVLGVMAAAAGAPCLVTTLAIGWGDGPAGTSSCGWDGCCVSPLNSWNS